MHLKKQISAEFLDWAIHYNAAVMALPDRLVKLGDALFEHEQDLHH